MDSDLGKLFIGGISWETTEERLKDYFSNYGEVTETVIMKDRTTGRARGFGFVVFADPSVADRVLLEKHTLDGRTVEAKKAVPRDEQQNVPRGVGGGGSVAADSIRTKKIFVGGLASTVSEEDFKKYFEQFGTITDVVVMYDQATQRPRGFGFITFDSEDAVDNVLQKSFHELNEKLVEVKRAIPKELQGPASARSPGGPFGGGAPRGSPFGSGYGQGYSSSAGGYGGRYGPGPDLRGGYPTYGGSGYGAAGYAGGGGYGASMNGSYGGAIGYGSGAGYGGGSYGSALGGGYGAGATGYSALASAGSGGYGFASGRNTWGSGGYGSLGSSAGYGGVGGGYGGSGGWSSGSGGAGQSAGSTGGYGSADYGYGGSHSSAAGSYGGRDAGYGSGVGGYGAQSVAMGSGSYGASSYGDGYAASGYPDSTWRSTSSEPYGAAAGAVTGYGGAVSASDISSAGYGESGWPSRASDARVKSYPATGDHTGY